MLVFINTIFHFLYSTLLCLTMLWKRAMVKSCTHPGSFCRARRKTQSELNTTSHYYHPKKPDWVVDKILYLQAMMPDASGRALANTFNRLYRQDPKTPMTVGKTWVCETIKENQYEIQVLRRDIKNRKLKAGHKNKTWGADLTTVTDADKNQHLVFSVIDHGTRACLCMVQIPNKSSSVILQHVSNCIKTYGKPKYIRTDNEMVFCSRLFDQALDKLSIRHQCIDKGCPWQNGRVERFFGTFKQRINQLVIENAAQLTLALPQFLFWYNHIRVHQHLDGRTPAEVWRNTCYHPGKQPVFFNAWDGLLTGYYFPV